MCFWGSQFLTEGEQQQSQIGHITMQVSDSNMHPLVESNVVALGGSQADVRERVLRWLDNIDAGDRAKTSFTSRLLRRLTFYHKQNANLYG